MNYACILALFFPFVWFARYWEKVFQPRWWLLLLTTPVLLVAIQLSFTRAAYVALALSLVSYIVIRLKLMRIVLLLGVVVTIGGVAYLLESNRYLDYAPEYKRAVTHYKFDNLLEATAKGEDISTMERVYRWVAGMHMNKAKPGVGFGPGNFYNFYRSYTVSSFRTYVSDNPEKSGIHSYYLMTLVEQGFLGMFIFIGMCFYVLIRGEKVYHECRDVIRKRMVMIAILGTIVIDALLLINDMIETDKVGPFFFLFMAIVVNVDLANQRDAKALT